MKNFALSILTLLYLTVSSGIAMEIHYCMGEYAGTELYGSDKETCGVCGMKEKKGGCCEDDHKFYKLEDSHKKAVSNIDFTIAEAIVAKTFSKYTWNLPEPTEKPIVQSNSPPGFTPLPARIFHGVFRI